MENYNLNNIITGVSNDPPRILVYGGGGLGKTSFAAAALTPIMIQTEDGLGEIDVARFPLAKTWQDVDNAMGVLYQQDHAYKTLIIDSLDWYEPMIWDYIIAKNPVNSKGKTVVDITDYGYGQGYAMATDLWIQFLDKCDKIRRDKGMAIVFVAHDEVRKFDDPAKGTYNYYGPKLHKFANEKMIEYCDVVLFVNQGVTIATDKNGFGVETKRVMGDAARVVLTQERPHAVAKNRYQLPAEITVPDGDVQWKAVWDVLRNKINYFKEMK